MRTVGKIAAVAAVTTLALTACSKQDDGGTDDSDGNTNANASICESADGDGPKVGLAYDVGGRGDQSFNDAAYAGIEKAVEEVDATCFEAEAANDEPESARVDRLRKMADEGLSPIIGVGFAYSESVNEVAPDYPETSFAVVDGFDPDTEPNANVAYLGFAEQEGSYLVGVAAALKSEAGHIAFVGGVHNDLIKKFEAGFTAGAKSVKPKIKVGVRYIEETDLSGFDDPAGGKAAAQGLIDKGADVIYHASGGSGAGVFEAVAAAGDGVWAIGVDSDQYLTAPEDQKAHILTSMLKRVDVATADAIRAVSDGKPLTSYQTYDLKVDGVGYSTSGDFITDIKDQIDAAAEKIKSGEVKVPTTP